VYQNYLSIGGVEILNGARATAYVQKFLPKLQVKCTDSTEGLGSALGHSPYVSPATDKAPWYKATRPQTARFYGLFPGKISGLRDSTRTVELTELAGDGAIHSLPRHGSKEIRVVALALAADREALDDGLTWLRDVLGANCAEGTFGCTGRELAGLTALPESRMAASSMWRTFHRVEVIDGPKITKEFPDRAGAAVQVEFLISAGIPWAFTPLAQIASLALDNGTSWSDPEGEDCSAEVSAYGEFINDPFFTAISQPPRPATVKPPNILQISSWRRSVAHIPESVSGRWGRVVPVVHVSTQGAIQQLRIRFYRTDQSYSGCGFDGEFLISYLPAWAVMTIDGIKREVTVRLADGRTVPGGHLLYGSDGTPFTWPTMSCHHKYTMVADIMPGQAGVAVMLDTAVRE
jgi:hypothetical protein